MEVFEIIDKVLIKYNGNSTQVEIPEGVEKIGKHAFQRNLQLESLALPDSIQEISPYAFYGCEKLRSVKFGSGLKNIGCSAFEFCSNFKEIFNLPNGVYIDQYAFFDRFSSNIKERWGVKAVKGFNYINGELYGHGFHFKVGQTYSEMDAQLCLRGFHACLNGKSVFNHYFGKVNEDIKFYEVEMNNLFPRGTDDTTVCASSVRLIRELSLQEVIKYEKQKGVRYDK